MYSTHYVEGTVMGKKKTKTKKKNAGPPKPTVRLSQCMIVKNEEKNIEKALGWAKGIAYEQIVVDTGSTDHTVELAEKMGAKVYHFEWINDFAAAKNFAIEQAQGNWIAFLDADEYLSPGDANNLVSLLRKINSETELREKYYAIISPLAQLDDQGKPFSIDTQIRTFRNLQSLRYVGAIHEILSLKKENLLRAENITVMHTGYAKAVYDETDKADRNINLLRAEIAKKPDDLNLKVYLADSLDAKAKSEYRDGEAIVGSAELEAEAEVLYAEVADSDGQIFYELKRRAHILTIDKSILAGKPVHECERLCLRALKIFPEDLDFEYYLARTINGKGDYRAAWELLLKCEHKLINGSDDLEATLVAVKPRLLFFEMVTAANGLGDVAGIVKYATMVLMDEKALPEILKPYIVTLLENDTTEDEVVSLLSRIYDLSDPKDIVFIARAAKDCGAIDLARRVAGMATQLIKQ